MKHILFFLSMLILTGIFFSCGSFKPVDQSVRKQQSIYEVSRDESSLKQDKNLGVKEDRKIVYSASMNMEVSEPDSTAEKIGHIARRYKGYVARTGTQGLVIRVPSDKFNDALDEVVALGGVENKSIKGEDVTEEYLDLEIRLDNAQKARARYLELLEKAENVSEALKVERELERLAKEIDLLKGKINRLSNLSRFATISVDFIDVTEEPKPGPIGYIFVGLYKGIKWLFVRN